MSSKALDIPFHVSELVRDPPEKLSGRRRLPDLDELTNISDDALLLVQHGSKSFKVQKSILLSDTITDNRAEIYTYNGDSSPAITQTPGATPVLYTGFESNGPTSGGAVADSTNNKIVIAETGIYTLFFQISFSGTINSTWFFHPVIISDSPVTDIERAADRKLGTGGDVGSCSFGGEIQLTAGDEVGIYVSGTAGADINTHHVQFSLKR